MINVYIFGWYIVLKSKIYFECKPVYVIFCVSLKKIVRVSSDYLSPFRRNKYKKTIFPQIKMNLCIN